MLYGETMPFCVIGEDIFYSEVQVLWFPGHQISWGSE